MPQTVDFRFLERRFTIRILGVDPGLATVGVAVIEEGKLLHCGIIATGADREHEKRLLEIRKMLKDLVRKWKAREAAVERLFFSRNAKTAMKVSEARGVILMTLAECGCGIFEYTPVQVKQAITGTGSADKEQVQKMVKMIFGLKQVPRPDDAADAAAIAFCHGQNRRVRKLEQ